jgi:hypothetical protein
MLRNVLIAITAAVLLGTISLLAAEKMKEKKAAEKEQQAQAVEQQRPGMLLDELIAAYKANDREKMGQIIQKMEQRREKMQKFARPAVSIAEPLNRWHRWANRRMEMQGRGWGEAQRSGVPEGGPGWGMAGPEAGFYRGQREGPRWRNGCGCCEAQRSGALLQGGVPEGGPGWGCCEKNNWGPPAREYGRMPGFGRGERPWREGFEGRGRGDWRPGPDQRFGPEFNPERQHMMPRDNPSPDSDW